MALKLNQLRRFTADEYMRMAQQGILPADERTELLDGRIVLKMSQNPPHVGGIILANDVFLRAFGSSHWVAPQTTVRLSKWSAPEPDFVLVRRSEWRPGLPLKTGDLFMEVSDSSLDVDREVKAALYAQAGVPEYWIVNLVERQIEVYRDLIGSEAEGRYQSVTIHREGEVLAPLCRPDVSIAVSDLLPEPCPNEQP